MPAEPLEAIDPRDLGARLRAARNARGLTQQEAADALGLARTTMVAIEKGDRHLKSGELIRLARLYGRKLNTLLRPGAPAEAISLQLRRALPADLPSDSGLAARIDELERLYEDYLELERLCGAPLARQEPRLYSIEGIDPGQAAEDVATAERNRLGLGDAPVLNLRAMLEGGVGLRIFYLDLPPEVSGMFAFDASSGGTLAVNRNHPAERRRLSLARLYGHLLTDRHRPEITLPGSYERRPAGVRFEDAFGRAFLLPATSLRRRFHAQLRQSEEAGRNRPTVGDLCHLAHFYFVAVETVAWRLEELRLLPRGTWNQLHKRGFRLSETRRVLGLPERPADDQLLPARYRYLAVEAWQRGDLSEGQLASFLRLDRLDARRTAAEIGLERDDESPFDLSQPLAADGAA